MILVAGVSPAWQQIMEFDGIATGEVNRARCVTWCASGKVLNVALALRSLTARFPSGSVCHPHVMSLLGGWSGAAIQSELDALGLASTWLQVDVPTRVCTTLLDAGQAVTTELIENSGHIDLSLAREFQDLVIDQARSAEFVVLTGSIPANFPDTWYAELLEQIRAPVLLDFRGPQLRACLPHRPRVVKPNREELAATVGRSLPTRDDVLTAMRELNTLGADWVVVSGGPEEILVTSANDFRAVQPPVVDNVVNPIGCGDCLAAGIALGLTRGDDLWASLAIGIQAATDNVQQLLPARCQSIEP
ncbi:MAG: bifunctional hydroxymethylpyrimidine kinase/phosphomethylpyrimidine kinase [Planctomycetaceae bacterium]|nr:bifunctional hydroxymethylpyrimidine kinase/phosphomethylpyrimidine kinase [Planctomycetaceae bacterium]